MLTEMEYVYRVYQEKSFTKAAEALYLTQPALSMAIRKAEDALGMPIFDRSLRPLGLTPAGEVYIQHIRDTLELEQTLRQQIQDIRELNTGSIRIGGSHYINAYILPPVLARFSEEYPRVQLDLVENSSAELSRMLARRELDLTFNCNPRFMQDFERYHAFTDHILLAVPQRFRVNETLSAQRLTALEVAQKRHLEPDCPCVGLDRFRREPFILLNSGNNLHDRATQLFQEARMVPEIRMEVSQLVTAYHLADAAMGAAFVSDRLVVPVADRLYYYKLDSELAERDFYMLLPQKNYTSQAVRTFVKYFGRCMGPGLRK